MLIPFTGLYQSDSPTIANIECENVYINKPQTQGAQSTTTLLGGAGIYQVATAGEGTTNVCRGAHVKNGIPYFVMGQKLYSLTRSFDDSNNEILTLNELGDVSGFGRVSMADNGSQLMVLVPGGDAYIYNEDEVTQFQVIGDPDFYANGNPQQVVFIDSFFVCSTDTKKFIKSASNDGLSWNALDFGSAEADPDDIVAPIVFKNQLYIAGSEIFEVFQNLGTGGFPFQRINGFIINKGVYAPFSLVKTSESFMFIGGGENESPAIWALSGSQVQKVSNTAIDSQLQRYTIEELQQSFAYSYAQKGAYFVCFSLPDKTYIFDTISQEWHERTSRISIEGQFIKLRWRVNALVTAYGRVFVGDSQDGRIGVLDPDTYQEYDTTIVRTFSAIAIQAEGRAVSTTELELQMETGTADITLDPQVRMDYSDDGKRWSNEMWRSMGKIGRFGQRIVWNRLGRTPYFRIYRFQISDPVKVAAVKLTANLKVSPRG